MPGSRRKEVEALLPEFGKAARILCLDGRDVTFHCRTRRTCPKKNCRSDVPVA